MNTSPILRGFSHNLILNTDSYKVSHWKQYPEGLQSTFSYIESRGGRYPAVNFFGLQMFIREYLCTPVTLEMVAEAKAFYAEHLPGVPFNEAGWARIVERHGGFLPITIKAAPEGLAIPVGHVMLTLETNDPELAWLGSWLETALLRAVWYPSTVATQSRAIKEIIRIALLETAGSDEGVDFKLHDFGARGVSSLESAALGGAAHLVNFQGSDTISGVIAANRYYDAKMSAYSIPASEHSTITSWGRSGELDAYRNMLTQFAKPGSLVAVVSDSYDLYFAVSSLWGDALRDEVIQSGATIIIRPDSGEPRKVVVRTAQLLDQAFGSEINSNGYRVLKYVRIIQGDGVCQESISDILQDLKQAGYSAENIAFGMGGALLQQIDRDTQRFAMKISAVNIRGEWQDTFKQPVTDLGKASKKGRITLLRDSAGRDFLNARLEDAIPPGYQEALELVYRNGQVLRSHTLDEIRRNAEQGYSAQEALLKTGS